MATGDNHHHHRHDDDGRYAVDIRVFLSVIVIAMAVSFGIGVGLGPTAEDVAASLASSSTVPATTTGGSKQQELPHVTSVEIAEADEFDFSKTDDLHEPAGQVRSRCTVNMSCREFVCCDFRCQRSLVVI
jgi:hypothetical protein